MRRASILAAAAAVLGALALAATAAAAGGLQLDRTQLSAGACDAGGPPLVDVHYTFLHDADSGFAGNAWAMDTIFRSLRIWQVGAGQFCAIVVDVGTFTTLAGPSPSGAGTVSAGVVGVLGGGYRAVFGGTFAPTLPTRGYVGTYDLRCDTSFNCPGDVGRPTVGSYVSGAPAPLPLAWWGWIYRAGGHGTWLNAVGVAPADSGDITG